MMKRIIVLLAGLLCVACCWANAEGELTARDLNSTDAFAFSLERVLHLTPPDDAKYNNYFVQQGCCTDGIYAYTILENQKIGKGSIWKLDMKDWSVVDTKYNLPIDHGNDITYNPVLDQLIVVHNKPNYTFISFVDPDTLKHVAAKELPYRMYAISYEPTRDQYVVGISGTFHFAILDSNFETLAYYEGVDTGFTKQNIDSDENYIYFSQWKGGTKGNVVMVYDWEGNFVTQIRVKGYQEIESLLHVGDEWYIAFYSDRASHIYRATLEYDSKKAYQSTLYQ